MKRSTFALFLFGLVSMNSSMAADSYSSTELRVAGTSSYAWQYMSVPSSTTANYSGYAFGGEIALKFDPKNLLNRYYTNKFSFALVGSYSAFNSQNSANTLSQTESLNTTLYRLGLRGYIYNFFIGGGAGLTKAKTTRLSNGVYTHGSYFGTSFYFEGGYDFLLSRTFFISPRIFYTTGSLAPDSGTVKRTLQSIAASTLVGVRF